MNHPLSRRRFLAAGSAVALAGCAVASGADAAVASPGIGLGFSLYGMKSLPLNEALAACAKIGYDNVELALMPGFHADPAILGVEDRRKLRDSLAANKLRISALMENLLLLAEEKLHAANLDRLKLAGELARDLVPESPPLIETVLGGKPADWEATRDRMIERLVTWAKVAGEQRVVLAIKGHVANAAHLPEQVVSLVKAVASPWLKAAYDFSHFELRGLGLAESLKTLLPHIVFIHVKDTQGEAAKFQFLLPGAGKTDYATYFKLLAELGYAGDVVVEVSGQIHSKPDYEPLAAARKCYDCLAPVLEKSGARRKRSNS